MALGRDGGDVLRSLILQGLRPMMSGCVLGSIAASGFTSNPLDARLPRIGRFPLRHPTAGPGHARGITTFLASIAVPAGALPSAPLKVDRAVALRRE
jgi:hypothetical protein